MKLHSGILYWPEITKVEKTKFEDDFDPNKNDILIVGGGISGAISAYRLAKEGYGVTLIEKNEIGSGSSSANTGLIQYMSDKGVRYYINSLGYDEGKGFYDKSVKAIATLTELDRELENLDVPTFEIKKSLILATEEDKVSELKAETEKQKEFGYGAEYFDKEFLSKLGIDAFGGLCAKPDIALNPFGFVHRLIRSAVEKYNLHIMEKTEFISVEDCSDFQIVNVEKNGKRIRYKFKKVIFATGYEPPEMFKEKLSKLIINKTYVTVSRDDIQLDENTDYLTWEVREPYTYFRHTFENSLMIGGLDEPGDSISDVEVYKNKNNLIRLTKEMLIDKNLKIEPEYSYVALFGESEDDIPYIGVDTDNKNLMVICGAGGNGTVYSTIASEFAISWVKNDDLSDYKIFSLGR